METKRIIKWILIALMCCLVSVCGYIGIKAWNYYQRSQQVLTDLSQRIGVEADWRHVRGYLYCEQLRQGMTKEQVEMVLDTLGPYLSAPYDSSSTYKMVYFRNQFLDANLSPLVLVFENGILMDWGRGESNIGVLAKCEQTVFMVESSK